MKILYIANVRIPTQRAHGIQVMQMCKAFVRAGNRVEMLVPKRINSINEDPFRYYGVEKSFKITRLATIDAIVFDRVLGALAYWIQVLTFYLRVGIHLLLGDRGRLIFTRDAVGIFLRLLGYKVVYEMHSVPSRKKGMFFRVLRHATFVVAITHGLKDACVRGGMQASKIFVAPDGVDLNRFTSNESMLEARELLGIAQDKKVALYVGHLYGWKGADTFVRSAQYLEDVQILLVGGDSDEEKKLRERVGSVPENVTFLGARPHAVIPRWLAAADVFVLPNSGKEKISKHYTSPLKMFEYMASGRLIVASDLPSIREVLNEKNAILISSDDPKELAQGIQYAVSEDAPLKRAEKALQDVQKYSWRDRAVNISQFITTNEI